MNILQLYNCLVISWCICVQVHVWFTLSMRAYHHPQIKGAVRGFADMSHVPANLEKLVQIGAIRCGSMGNPFGTV
jgi:hypothetical protein